MALIDNIQEAFALIPSQPINAEVSTTVVKFNRLILLYVFLHTDLIHDMQKSQDDYHFSEYRKLYFFARAKKNLISAETHSCFSKNCTGVFSSEPQQCPVGYNQTGFKEVCANCSAPFGVYNLRCECKNWMSCAHRAYSELNCPSASPFMQFKVRECTQGMTSFSLIVLI